MNNKNSDKNLKDLGDKLRRARELVKLTQTEVARVTDISVNYYARIERGEVTPSLDCLKRIMEVLKIKTLNISEL